MAWNEPGGGKDPWGGKRGNDGPPDLDEALKQLKKKFSQFRRWWSNGSGGLMAKVYCLVAMYAVLYSGDCMGFTRSMRKSRQLCLRLGKYHDTLGSGLQWNPQLVDKVYTVRVTEERQYSARGLMLTQDENIVEISLTVQYNIARCQRLSCSIFAIQRPASSMPLTAPCAM